MKITYTRVGDYYLPNLAAPESPKVGRWGMLRFNYLRKHREAFYTTMLMENTLNPHLEEVDRQAQEMEQYLISQLAQQEGVTERLKAENQMECVAWMNNIRNRADEIGLNDLIYAEKKEIVKTAMVRTDSVSCTVAVFVISNKNSLFSEIILKNGPPRWLLKWGGKIF